MRLTDAQVDEFHRSGLLAFPQLFGDDRLYLQQVKVNAKQAFTGEQWQWHYDFATRHHEDGVAAPLALNVHIFLDEVTEFNGPLVFIPRSHLDGPAPTSLDLETTSYPLWTVAPDVVGPLAERGGLACPKGPAGTVLMFGDTMARPDHQHHRDISPVEALDEPFSIRR